MSAPKTKKAKEAGKPCSCPKDFQRLRITCGECAGETRPGWHELLGAVKYALKVIEKANDPDALVIHPFHKRLRKAVNAAELR